MENNNGVTLPYWLADKVMFAESLLKDTEDRELELDPWQRMYLSDDSPFIAVLKGRQGGFSYLNSVDGVVDSHLVPGFEMFVVSINLEEAKNKIKHAKALYDSMPERFKLRLVIDSKTELGWVNNKGKLSTLKALTSKAQRGYSGKTLLDEICHYQNEREVFAAALGIASRGGMRKFRIGSTPLDRSGVLYDVIANERGKFNQWRTYRIPWFMTQELCLDVRRAVIAAKEKRPMSEIVKKWGTTNIKTLYDTMLSEDFMREFCCQFMDGASAFLPFELIKSCQQSNFGEDPTESEVDYLCMVVNRQPTEQDMKWLSDHCRGLIEIGYDVGHDRNISALVVSDEVNGIKDIRFVAMIKNATFPAQEAILRSVIRAAKPVAVRIDRGGMGIPLCDAMVAEYGDTLIQPINFTVGSKQEMATNLKMRFEKKTIRIPADEDFLAHLRSIRKEITDSNSIIFTVDAKSHNADLFWGTCLTDYRSKGMIQSVGKTSGRRNRLKLDEVSFFNK